MQGFPGDQHVLLMIMMWTESIPVIYYNLPRRSRPGKVERDHEVSCNSRTLHTLQL